MPKANNGTPDEGTVTSRPQDTGTQLEVTLEDFANSFDTRVEELSEYCGDVIAKTDFRYRVLQEEERDMVLLDVLKTIEADQQQIGAKERKDVWEKGWAENLQAFVKSGFDLSTLVPKFIRPNQFIRLNGNYIVPSNPYFELDYFSVFRLWLFRKYLKDFKTVYEFGCGTGMNLVTLAHMYPEMDLHGLDFSLSSRNMVNKIAETHGLNITGHLFDMISPDKNFELTGNSAVFTFGAIEQLAGKFEEFLQFLLKRSPALCINLEPILEFYDENNLVDYLAIKFHTRRGYTSNWLSRLRELECQGVIEILKAQRLFFGSLYMEGYSYVVWRPKNVRA